LWSVALSKANLAAIYRHAHDRLRASNGFRLLLNCPTA
jgi:hypothetical protein